jgi:DNA-binding XRE family transcriptional regulator
MGASPRTADREVVYNRIPLLRADRGISRGDLAVALGIHYQTVGYIERGEYAPSLHLALRLAAFFGLPVEAIFSVEPFQPLGAAALLGRQTPDQA